MATGTPKNPDVIEAKKRRTMSDAVRERFLELLEKDAEMLRQAAEVWTELERYGACLQSLDGTRLTSASEMVQQYRKREKELRDLVERVRRG